MKEQEYMHLEHPIPALFDAQSQILVLGSFPSVKSREMQFFYGHPQNRFWKVVAQVFGGPVPTTIPEKSEFLHAHHIALWDVIASCDIIGSSDSSIKNAVVNDINGILQKCQIKRIFVNGGTAARLYEKYIQKQTGIEAIKLPSTSPANASWSLERLCEAWKIIK